MLEPLPSNLSAFQTVQVVFAGYLVAAVAITAGLVQMGLPMDAVVYAFLLILVVLGFPLLIIVRRIHPDPPTL